MTKPIDPIKDDALSECCSPEAQADCCKPEDKDGCCTPKSSSCGC